MATLRNAPRHRAQAWLRMWFTFFLFVGSASAQSTSAPAGVDGGTAALVPPTLRTPSPATYPQELLAQGLRGEILLELLIDVQGAVQEVQVVSGGDPAFETEAKRAAWGLAFLPATLNGQPTPVRLRYTYNFEPAALAAPKVSPTGKLSGWVRAKGSRRPIPGTTFQEETTHLGEAGADGTFELELTPGEHALTVRAPGFKPNVFHERIVVGEQVEVVYALEPLRIDPYETIVRGERARNEVSRVTLHDQELREVPGTMGDPFRVVMLMPGVASIASGIAYPVVRGTQPAATGYFIDGIRVPALFHAMLGPAVVHPEFIDSIDFFPGTPPVRYGRLLGGAIEGYLSRPRDDRLHAQLSADLINASGFVEVPFEKTGTNVTLAGRFSYSAWLIALLVRPPATDGFKQTPIAEMYDYQARVEQKVGSGKLRLLAFGSSDVFGVTNEDPQGLSARFVSIFHRGDLRYRRPVGGGELELGFTLGAEEVGLLGERGGTRVGNYLLKQTTFDLRSSYARDLSPRLKLTLGADLEHRRSETVISAQVVPTTDTEAVFHSPLTLGTFFGAYGELQWLPASRWTLVPGVRFDHFHLAPDVYHASADPRLAVRFAVTDKVTLKAGVASLHQPPTVLVNLPVMDIAGLRYGLQESLQTDVGVEWKAAQGLEINADVYVNPVLRAVEFDLLRVLQDRRRSGVISDDVATTGQAYGFELMVRHPLGGNWFGWLSYSFQRSFRRELFARFDDQFNVVGRVTADVPFAFEQVHVINAAVSYKFANGFTLGTVLHFNTGRPESGEISSRTMRQITNSSGQLAWAYVDKDRVDRLPPFFRADLRLSKSWLFDNFVLDAYLDVMNATLSSEVLAYDYLVSSQPPALVKNPTRIPLVVPLIGLKGTY